MKKTIGLFLLILVTGLCAKAQSAFDKKIADAVKQLNCMAPSAEEPVTLNAGIVAERDSLAVFIKVLMAPGWHIYQFVPAHLPYIVTEPILKLSEGIKAVGKWETSKPSAYSNDPGVLIHETEAWFVQKTMRQPDAKGVMQAGLYYQTCDLNQCLPPVEKTLELKIPQKN